MCLHSASLSKSCRFALKSDGVCVSIARRPLSAVDHLMFELTTAMHHLCGIAI
jgi:hypothetical protein